MNLVYIIPAHKNPDQLVRLIRRLNAEDTSFYVHVDKRSPRRVYRAMVQGVHDLPNIHFLKRHICYYADFGVVRGVIEGIKYVIEKNVPFDYLIYLTGQDYPLKTNEQIKDYLAMYQGYSFICYSPLPFIGWHETGGVITQTLNTHVD